jgi:decaprenylphospho-beta-D-ribofuranose 2-oxidase
MQRGEADVTARRVALAGWGRYPIAECNLLEPEGPDEIVALLCPQRSGVIARGNGRSYGDSSLSPSGTLVTRRLDRLLAFDDETGTLSCEAGVLLSDIIDTFVPRGWFPPVTPGTRFVTVGGMIASDVHGKNHHVAGSFCDHVSSIVVATGNGGITRCSRSENGDLFSATCGGMGLTGVILRATFSLTPILTSRIEQIVVRARDLQSAMDTFEQYGHSTYSVAWIDCFAPRSELGRSVIFVGEHATPETLPAADRSAPLGRKRPLVKRLPFDLPSLALNKASIKAFNGLYYRLQRPGKSIVDLEAYFYPLDSIEGWNRMYGARGFVQYQCVLPLETSRSGLVEVLTQVAEAGLGSFLAVLKRLGKASVGDLSFPLEGYTLALDFPAKRATFELLERLDAIVIASGGRVYLTKDARASARVVAAGYPGLTQFRETRIRYALDGRFESLQSRRLEL